MATKDELTPKQLRFCDEFPIDLNGTKAAKRAGYSPKGADVRASELLGNRKVRSEIDRRLAKMSKDAGITAQMVVEEFGKLAFSNMGDYIKIGEDGLPYVNFKDLTKDQKAAISEVTVDSYKEKGGTKPRDIIKVKFKLADKKGALDSLGKHLGMFVDRVEHSGPDGGPMVIERTIIDPPNDSED